MVDSARWLGLGREGGGGLQGARRNIEDAEEGDRVYIKGYGYARIDEFVHWGQYRGRIKIRYDDIGDTYHVLPEQITLC